MPCTQPTQPTNYFWIKRYPFWMSHKCDVNLWTYQQEFFKSDILDTQPTNLHFGCHTEFVPRLGTTKEVSWFRFSCRVLQRAWHQGEGVAPWGTLRIPFGKIGGFIVFLFRGIESKIVGVPKPLKITISWTHYKKTSPQKIWRPKTVHTTPSVLLYNHCFFFVGWLIVFG